MLANRLNVLLAERQLNIKQVVEDTEISRSSISNIVNNPDANISTTTIDKLCNYLGVTPSEFWAFSPYEITTKSVFRDSEYEGDILLSVIDNKNEFLFQYYIEFYDYRGSLDSSSSSRGTIKEFDIEISMEEIDDRNNMVTDIFHELEPIFKTHLSNLVTDNIKNIVLDYMNSIDLYVYTSNGETRMSLKDYMDSRNEENILIFVQLPWEDTFLKFNNKSKKFK